MAPFLEWAVSACVGVSSGVLLGGGVIAACQSLDWLMAYFTQD